MSTSTNGDAIAAVATDMGRGTIVKFIPSNLTKALVGVTISAAALAYAAKKFIEMVQEKQETQDVAS